MKSLFFVRRVVRISSVAGDRWLFVFVSYSRLSSGQKLATFQVARATLSETVRREDGAFAPMWFPRVGALSTLCFVCKGSMDFCVACLYARGRVFTLFCVACPCAVTYVTRCCPRDDVQFGNSSGAALFLFLSLCQGLCSSRWRL